MEREDLYARWISLERLEPVIDEYLGVTGEESELSGSTYEGYGVQNRDPWQFMEGDEVGEVGGVVYEHHELAGEL